MKGKAYSNDSVSLNKLFWHTVKHKASLAGSYTTIQEI